MAGCEGEGKKHIKVTLPKGMEGCVDACCVEVVFCEDTEAPAVCIEEAKIPCAVRKQERVALFALEVADREGEGWEFCCDDDPDRVPDADVPCIVLEAEKVYNSAVKAMDEAGYELVDEEEEAPATPAVVPEGGATPVEDAGGGAPAVQA